MATESKQLNRLLEASRRYGETKAKRLTEFLDEIPNLPSCVKDITLRQLEVAFLDGAIAGLEIATHQVDEKALAELAKEEAA